MISVSKSEGRVESSYSLMDLLSRIMHISTHSMSIKRSIWSRVEFKEIKSISREYAKYSQVDSYYRMNNKDI